MMHSGVGRYDAFLSTFRIGGIYHSVRDDESQVVVTGRSPCEVDVRGTVDGRFPICRYTDRDGRSSEYFVVRSTETMRVRWAFYALDFVGLAEGMEHGPRLETIYEMAEEKDGEEI